MSTDVQATNSHSPDAHIAFDSDEEEVGPWASFMCRRSFYARRYVKRTRIVFAIYGCFATLVGIPEFFLSDYPDLNLFSAAAPWLVGGGILLLVFALVGAPAYARWAYRQELLASWKAAASEENFGRYTMDLIEDRLHLRSPTSYAEIPIARCYEIEESDTHSFLMIDRNLGAVIARAKVVEGNLETFLGAIRSKLAQTRSAGE